MSACPSWLKRFNGDKTDAPDSLWLGFYAIYLLGRKAFNMNLRENERPFIDTAIRLSSPQAPPSLLPAKYTFEPGPSCQQDKISFHCQKSKLNRKNRAEKKGMPTDDEDDLGHYVP